MSRKSIAKKPGCALCGAKEVSEPKGEERYCRDCWDKKIAVEEIVAREFALKRYIRAHSAEKYLVYHSTQKRPCGQLIVVDDGYDLFLTMMLYPNFAWDEPAYHLEGDPEGRTFAELLVDVVATEVIEPWGGGKWHLEMFPRPPPPNPRTGTARCDWIMDCSARDSRIRQRHSRCYNPRLGGCHDAAGFVGCWRSRSVSASRAAGRAGCRREAGRARAG